MSNYTIGSVADLISEGKVPVKKSKKNKKLIKEQNQWTGATENITTNDMPVKKIKSKNPNTDDATLKPKKRKKAIFEDSNVESTTKPKKQKKDLLELNKMPSDSEEETDTEEAVVPVKKPKNVKIPIKFEPKDFIENTVFVGNIPITYDKQKTHKVFSKFGKIKSIRIRCVPIADINMSKKVAAVKKKFNSNRNSLVAYVKFKSKESAEAALEANGMVVEGHHLRVDLAEEKKEHDNNKAVFVGGLPFDTEDDDLWELFQNCGKINSVRVIRDAHTSMGKGFGYVNFDSTAAVELALQLDGQQLKKRTINVKRCMKGRNKNKLNTFGKKKSTELTNELLAKRGKKFKAEKKKMRTEKKPIKSDEYQGWKANVKHKKKKKLSKDALRKKKVMKILGTA